LLLVAAAAAVLQAVAHMQALAAVVLADSVHLQKV
jgi:hypothetical protein